MEIINWTNFVGKLVFLHAPRAMRFQDRHEIQATLCLEFSAVVDVLTIQEMSRAIGRAVYRECKARGWRKRRERMADGSVGKAVRWCHEAHYISENERRE